MVAELIAAKHREQLSVPYLDRFDDDLKTFAASVPEEIEKFQASQVP